MVWRNKFIFLIISWSLVSLNFTINAVDKNENVNQEQVVENEADSSELIAEDFNGLIINKVILQRHNQNNYVSDDIIRNSISYQKDEEFLPSKTTKSIKKLYTLGKPFGYFEQVVFSGKKVDDDHMDLIVSTYEKPILIDVMISGNSVASEKEIKNCLDIENVHALADGDLPIVIKKLERLYRSKDYHFAQIEAKLEQVIKSKNVRQTKLLIHVNEGKKSKVRRVLFKGNHNVPAKRLRSMIFTREDWLLGSLNKAGSYRPENLVADKHFIKTYYKSNGYLMANVADVQVEMDEATKQVDITFTIDEGDRYTVDDVTIDGGTDEVSNEFLLAHLPVQKGNVYSEKDVRDAVEVLRTIWGEHGYAFSEISPITVPDTTNRTVSINFNIDLGSKIYVNRINIVGNKKTRDKVIRRKLALSEGDLLTLMRMDVSKNKVMQLGYFDMRDGVNWKTHRLDDQWADLDLVLKEKKTGRGGLNAGYGGGAQTMSASNSFRIGGEVYDTNVLGQGYLLKLSGEWSKDAWTVSTLAANPWLFDRPIMGKIDFHVNKTDYDDELKNVDTFSERRIGVSAGIGFVLSPSRLRETSFEMEIAFDEIDFNKKPTVAISTENEAVNLLQSLLDKRFRTGGLLVLGTLMRQDFRNSAQHPTTGYQWSMITRAGFGVADSDIGYAKAELDASWYTPLIGEYDLVFGLHGHLGAVTGLGVQQIPYKEMFHIGGPLSVRGFLYGQIGPYIKTGAGPNKIASIGSTKAFFVNAELIFPITANMSLKGAFFYDGGAGWQTPGYNEFTPTQKALIINNQFDFRHAVGFGIRMLEPQPIKIDVGLKLDRRPNEPHIEVNFSTYREF